MYVHKYLNLRVYVDLNVIREQANTAVWYYVHSNTHTYMYVCTYKCHTYTFEIFKNNLKKSIKRIKKLSSGVVCYQNC